MATVTLTVAIVTGQSPQLFPMVYGTPRGPQVTRLTTQGGFLVPLLPGTLTGLSFVVQWWAGGTSTDAQIGLQRSFDGNGGSTAGILSTASSSAGAFYTDTIDASAWIGGFFEDLNFYAINNDTTGTPESQYADGHEATGTLVCVHANLTYSVPDTTGTDHVYLGHVINVGGMVSETTDKTYQRPAFSFAASGNRLTPTIPLSGKYNAGSLLGGSVVGNGDYATFAAQYPPLIANQSIIAQDGPGEYALLVAYPAVLGFLSNDGNPGDYYVTGNTALPYNPPGLSVTSTWVCADGLPLQNRAVCLLLTNSTTGTGRLYTWTDKNGVATFPPVYACCTGFRVAMDVDIFNAFSPNTEGCPLEEIIDESYFQYNGQEVGINLGCASGAYHLSAVVSHDPTFLLTYLKNAYTPTQQEFVAANASVLVRGIYGNETLLTDATGQATFQAVDPNTITSGEVHYQQVPTDLLTFTPDPLMDVAFSDSSLTGSNRYLTQCPRTYLWIRDTVGPGDGTGPRGGNCVEISQAQGWLHMGTFNATVSVVNATDFSPLYDSQPGLLVVRWVRFRSLPRLGLLAMLGVGATQNDGSYTSYLFVSADAGGTASPVLSIDNTTSSLIEATGAQGKLLVLTADNSGNFLISVRTSDDGQTFSDPVACMLGSVQFAGSLADATYWERGGVVFVALQTGGGTSVYQTSDFGLTFDAVL